MPDDIEPFGARDSGGGRIASHGDQYQQADRIRTAATSAAFDNFRAVGSSLALRLMHRDAV